MGNKLQQQQNTTVSLLVIYLLIMHPGAGFIDPAYDVIAGDNSSKA